MTRRVAPVLALVFCALAFAPRDASAAFLAGYASATSVAAGDTLGIHVSGDCPSLTLRFYRQQVDPELLLDAQGLVPPNPPVPDSAFAKGCGWPTLYTLTVPAEWPSGCYYVDLVPDNGDPVKHVPFVVRSSDPPRKILAISAVNTYQAYNAFGGKSLYDFNSPGGRARKVTFDRPYDSHDGLGQPQFEVPFIKWFEREGFAADWATDVDLALHPEILNGHRLLLIVGHNEYWTKSMYNNAQAFVDSGGNLAVLGGNTCYWQVRYEDAGRTLVCYKDYTDPMLSQQLDLTTVQWRDRVIRRPECLFFGVMYPYCAGTASDSITFTHPYTWITEGLEDEVGHRFGDRVVGYEYDTYFDVVSPRMAVRMFESPFSDVPGCPQTSTATYYERQPAFDWFGHGGGIFAAGTIQWSWGLEDAEGGHADPRMQLLTRNLVRGLSQPLRVIDYGVAIVHAHVDGPFATPQMPIYVEPVHVGSDSTSLGVFPMMDDGQWPDETADDGVYAGQFPLYPDERLPLKLKWSCGSTQQVTPVRAPDWFWLSDTQFDRDHEVYVRSLDSLRVDSDLVGAPPPAAASFRLVATPNPFASGLTLSWPSGSVVRRLSVHDARGRLVASLPVGARANSAAWDGRDTHGRAAAAGMYWARAEGAFGSRVARVVKLR